MDKNTKIFLGLGIIGAGALYFVSKTEGSKKTKDSVDVPTPPNGGSNVAKKVNVTGAVAKALVDNENPFIYNGKLVLLNNLLNVSKFQPFINQYTINKLKEFYFNWKGTPVSSPLVYGDPNKGNVDRYVLELYSAGKEVRNF